MANNRIWEDNKNVLTVVGLALLAALATQLIVVGPIGSAAEKDGQTYETLGKRLKSAREGPFDLADTTVALRRSSEDLEDKLEVLKKKVEVPFEKTPWIEIPANMAGDPGAWFALKHAEIRNQLFELCDKVRPRVVLSDVDLGFTPALNSPLAHDQATVNLRRLWIVEKLVTLLARAGVKEIVKINPSTPEMTGADKHGEFIREYPIEITVRSRLDPVMRFLHEIRRPGEFFLVMRELRIAEAPKSDDDDRRSTAGELDVLLSASGMRFPEESKLKRGAAPAPTRAPSKKRRPVPYGF